MSVLTPRDLLDLFHAGLRPDGPVAVDTETSGLYADDGARISTVSVAWADDTLEWMDFLKGSSQEDRVNWNIEQYAPGDAHQIAIVSLAWPFDQGREGKPESAGQDTLIPDADNLDQDQWQALMSWLWHVGGGDTQSCEACQVAEYTFDPTPQLVWHNAKFDLEKFRVGVRRWPGVGIELHEQTLWDTQNVNHLIYPLERTSLKPTCARLFGQEFADESEKVKTYLRKAKLPAGRWDLMPWDIVGPYADMDARLTLMLYYRQRWEIDANQAANWLYPSGSEWVAHEAHGLDGTDEVYKAIERRLAVTKLLYKMERRGVPYDEATSMETALDAKERARKYAEQLPFSPPNIVQAKNFFFGQGKTSKGVECLNLTPYSVTDKGAPQMTEEIVLRMVNDDVPYARLWREYNKTTNAASMWYTGYAEATNPHDGRLRTHFRQNGTVSARFSVERVNLQAIPHDYRLSGYEALEGLPTPRQIIKKAIAAIDGWRGWELDLAQAELRVAAMWAECETMLSMIAAGEDLHGYTTEALFDARPGDADWDKWRQVGKRGNFSLIFGSGATTFRQMVSKETGILLGEVEAERIVRDWNALYPEFRRAIDKHQVRVTRRQMSHGFGWIDTLVGERRWFERYEDTHKAFNQRVQGNLAQFGIDWMLATERYLESCGVDDQAREEGMAGGGLLLTIHDSQVLLLPDTAEGEKMAQTCADIGRDIWRSRFAVPGDVDAKAW